MSTLEKITNTTTTINSDGTQETVITEKTTTREKLTEPDYIKIYTNMWCEFNNIPAVWQKLFLELATRMTYANSKDLQKSQIVVVYGIIAKDICKTCGWGSDRTLRKGLSALCECNAIKKIERATYQINPSYAGKGEWKYNPRLKRGGIEDIVATFNFKTKQVETEIIWTNEYEDSDYDIIKKNITMNLN